MTQSRKLQQAKRHFSRRVVMYLTRISTQGFDSLPDQRIDLHSGLNILVDRSRLWHGHFPMLISAMLFGLSRDARSRLLPGDQEASGELVFLDQSQSYRVQVSLGPGKETIEIEATSAPGHASSQVAYAQSAATYDTSLAAHDRHVALSATTWRVTDLKSGLDQAFRSLAAERHRVSSLLDAISLKALQDKAARARQLASDLSRLEKEWQDGLSAGHSLSDDVMTVRSLSQHLDSLTSVISSKEAKVKDMSEQLEAERSKLDFYEYLSGVGFNEINTVRRSLERKRWLLDDLQELKAEIELGAKRIDAVSSMVSKYDRLTPFLGRREMELDHLEDTLKQLEARLPEEKLQQIESEMRAVRLQIQYWRKRRSIASVLSLLPLPFAFLWPPVALLSVVGAMFVYRYWREITVLVKRIADVDDRRDYLVLEQNAIETRMKSVRQEIGFIYDQTGVSSATELHDRIEDYQRLMSELEDLKRKADEREKARDELLIKLRDEEQKAGVLFDRMGLSAELNEETVEKFAEMVNSRVNDERLLKDLERKIEAEKSEINSLSRQVNTLQERIDEILSFYGVRSLSELQQLWDSSDAQEAKRLYEEKSEELRQLLNGQRLPDLESRIDLLLQLVPEADRVSEIPQGATPDRLETQLESIRVRADLLKWLRRSAMPAVVELACEGAIDESEKRQECVELCWMSKARQVLVLIPDESWEAAIRDVASDLGISTHTVMLGDYDSSTDFTEV